MYLSENLLITGKPVRITIDTDQITLRSVLNTEIASQRKKEEASEMGDLTGQRYEKV